MRIPSNDIQLVIFDKDGTIIDNIVDVWQLDHSNGK